MKNISAILLLLISTSTFAQTTKSCCSASSTQQFAMLASNEKFVASHLPPIPFVFTPAKGTMITCKAADGTTANAFEVKADAPTNNWIIMVHEWWGLNDYIKQEAEKLQAEIPNANVLAVDLYDGKVAENPATAQQLMGGLKEEHTSAIVKGAISYTGDKAKIATIGWCFGGGWSLQTCIEAKKQGVACVMYYGMPEKSIDRLKNLNCDVMGIFAKKDEWITPEVVAQFQKDMISAGRKVIVKSYDADHAFANPSNPHFDTAASADAHKQAVAFLKARIR